MILFMIYFINFDNHYYADNLTCHDIKIICDLALFDMFSFLYEIGYYVLSVE